MEEIKEPVIIVDDQDNQIAIVDRKIAEVDETNIIRYVSVLLFNDNGEVLLQRRSDKLERFPRHWEVSASGAVWPDEGYVDAANRKLPDELNMKVPLFHEHKSLISIPEKASRMTAVFVGFVKELTLVQPNEEKVEEARWVHLDEALKGYLLTPSCEQVLSWWREHAQAIQETIKSQS